MKLSKGIFRSMMKKFSETIEKGQLTNPISLFSLFLIIVVVVVAGPVAVSTLMKIAGALAKNQCRHQVFLNFRGEEVRNNFVSHLIDSFERNEINFFIDQNEERGKDLRNLFVRIKQSNIALAIFSTRYPESRWCMDELVQMKELVEKGKLIVIPIFYKVKAKDVRKPTIDSEFGRNFWWLEESSSRDQVKKWKEAFECISDKMGLSLGEDSSEADFIKEIVKEVKKVIEAMKKKE